MSVRRTFLLLLCLGTAAFCGFGAWDCVGRDLASELPDGAPAHRMALVEGPPAKEVFVRADGSLLRWTLDGRLVCPGGRRAVTGLRHVAYSSAADRVAALTADGRVLVFQGPKFRPLATVVVERPRNEYVEPFRVAISEDGATVATSDQKQSVFEWDAQTGRLRRKGHVEADRVLRVFFKADRSLWAVIERGAMTPERMIKVFEGEKTQSLEKNLHPEIGPYGRVATPAWKIDLGGTMWDALVSPDGKRVALSMSGTAGLWTGGRTAVVDAATGKNAVWLRHPARPMSAVAWWSGSLVVGGDGGYLGIFDPATGRRRWALSGHRASVRQAVVAESRLFTVDAAGDVRSIDLGTLP